MSAPARNWVFRQVSGYAATMSAPIVAFLSTGRCGTQWLTEGLRDLHPGASVEHEPIGPLYRGRRNFRRYDDPEALLDEPAVASHLDHITQLACPYIETGWPLFPVLPLLARRFGERLRIVHLTRHPVPTALSHLAHNSYAGSARDDAYTRWATLGPEDPRAFQPGYADRWDRLSGYERCLFWWTEVHAYALELRGRTVGAVPWLQVASERLLDGDVPTLKRLLSFMELGWDERWRERIHQRVDRWHHHTDEEVDPRLIARHPMTVEVARRLGYDPLSLDLGALRGRYQGRPDPGLDRIGRFASA